MASKSGLTMQGIIGMAIGVMSLVVVYIIIPLVGSQMDLAVILPASNATGAAWNATSVQGIAAGMPTAVSLWTAVSGIIKVGAILVIIGGFLRTLQGLRS